MTITELERHIKQQINNYLCFEINVEPYLKEAIKRTYNCMKNSLSKYMGGEVVEDRIPFSVFNSKHYCIFLYYMSRVAFEIDGNGGNAEKFYYLNKIMNAVDIFYEVELPAVWNVEHPLGSVMGRAKYSDYFFFYQGCTVGGNKMSYPQIGRHVIMYSDSKILGNAKIGDNVIISANTYIKDENIPGNSIVFGHSPNLIIKRKNEEDIKGMYSHIWKEEE